MVVIVIVLIFESRARDHDVGYKHQVTKINIPRHGLSGEVNSLSSPKCSEYSQILDANIVFAIKGTLKGNIDGFRSTVASSPSSSHRAPVLFSLCVWT